MEDVVSRRNSIITRLTLIVGGALVAAVLVVGGMALLEQRRQLTRALETKAASLAQFMAQVSPISVLSLNFVEMNNNVRKVVLTDDEAVYAIIVNEKGIPLAYYLKDADPAALLEVAHLAGLMANELGVNAKLAKRAGLLHDLGKAVDHEVEGSHAAIGGNLARRYGESDAVAHVIEAHHNEVDPSTVEAVLVAAADAVSGARPGARRETLETYIKRLETLERIAESKPGVEKSYAIQAGREIRVLVKPDEIDDDKAALLCREIAREIEQELDYPGTIRVTVIRESRAVDYAK